MSGMTPTMAEWRALYQAAGQIKEMAPWEWMTEEDMFGVQHPDTGELGFVSVMGQLGEHLSIAVYRGVDALYALWRFVESADPTEPERILEIPHLQASFEDRDLVEKQDRQVMKELGLKFRGRQAWPLFRSYRPGYAAWFLERAEAQLLTAALEQLANVAPRFQEDEALLYPEEENSMLVRVPTVTGDETTWADQIMALPPSTPQPIRIEVPGQVMGAVKQLDRSQRKLEADFFLMPSLIGARDERPRYAYILLVVETQSGFILSSDPLAVETTLEEMLGRLPASVLQAFVKLGSLPAEVRVRSDRLYRLLQPVCSEIGVKLRQTQRLPALDAAKQSMLQFFMR